MIIELRNRTENDVRIYFEKTQNAKIQSMIPQTATTVEQAVENFRKTQLPGASSYGRTIYVDDVYIGDIWCYSVDQNDTPNAMLSYCIFEESYWGKGIATAAVALFIQDAVARFHLKTMGAFAYCSNRASLRVLVKNGFVLEEQFTEDGTESAYYQISMEAADDRIPVS